MFPTTNLSIVDTYSYAFCSIHAQQNIHRIANWLYTYEPLFKQSRREAKKASIQQVSSITQFLTQPPERQAWPTAYSTQSQNRIKPFSDNVRRVTNRLQNYFTR